MKVVYEKTITEQIVSARLEASAQGKRIGRVVLSWDEMLRLSEEMNRRPWYSHSVGAWMPNVPTTVDGIKVALE